MKTISLEDLHKRALSRPPGYVEDVLSRAHIVTQTHYTISNEAFTELAEKYRASARTTAHEIDTSPAARLRRANLILHVQYPVLSSTPQYAQRYLACQRCDKAKRDNLGYAIGCTLCGCGSDPLKRRWARLDGQCADFGKPKWLTGELLQLGK